MTDDDLQEWLILAPDILDRFLESLDDGTVQRLDYSLESLNVLEALLLARFDKPECFRELQNRDVWEASALYIGDVYVKNLGWMWRIGELGFVYEGGVNVRGSTGEESPFYDARTCLDRRTGGHLLKVFRAHERQEEINRKAASGI